MTIFLAYEAGIKKQRFAFETQIETVCNEKLQTILEQTANELASVPLPNPGQPANDDLHQRFEAKYAELDAAYFSVDHGLTDISTYLDSEATSSRFIAHAVKGVGQGLFDELASNNGAGAIDVLGLFGKKGQALSKSLQQVEADMHTKATDAITQIKDTVSPAAALPQQTASATSNEIQ
jgi:hypothetical protein